MAFVRGAHPENPMMNIAIPMPDGRLHTLTDHDARVLDGFLADRECHAPESDQGAIARLRSHLKLALTPEEQYGDLYKPRGYEPGWVNP